MTVKIYKGHKRPSMTIRPKELAENLGISLTTLDNWIKAGEVPAPFKIGLRFKGWKRETINAWLDQREATATESKQP